MKMFSVCSGPCETCQTHYLGGCLAGHRDDEYAPASESWIREYEGIGGKPLDSAEKCGTFEVEERDRVLVMTFAEPMQFNEGDALTVCYKYDPDGNLTAEYEIERANEQRDPTDRPA